MSAGHHLACTVLSEHKLPPEPLPQRMLSNKCFEFGDRIAMAAEGQIRLQSVFQSLKTKLFQARDLALRGQFVSQLGER